MLLAGPIYWPGLLGWFRRAVGGRQGDRRRCKRGDAFLAPGKAEPFRRRCFDRDALFIDLQNPRERTAHGIAVRPDFRGLAHQRHIAMNDPPTACAHPVARAFEENP